MARTIITGVDGSESAARAAHRAAELADALGAELHVLSAYGKLEVEKIDTGAEQFIIDSMTDAERVARRVVDDLQGAFPGLAVTASPAEGKPGDALLEAADRLGAELIVVGNKRVQGIGRVLGSVARDVTTRATCDVYVAHTHQR
ncbi:universal stress protein [Georgenia sunbinii]|uniref:universal stress protein n=1 Tax=Georgenia sunbinii TaxID=3117728 RepID=UPI002F268773